MEKEENDTPDEHYAKSCFLAFISSLFSLSLLLLPFNPLALSTPSYISSFLWCASREIKWTVLFYDWQTSLKLYYWTVSYSDYTSSMWRNKEKLLVDRSQEGNRGSCIFSFCQGTNNVKSSGTVTWSREKNKDGVVVVFGERVFSLHFPPRPFYFFSTKNASRFQYFCVRKSKHIFPLLSHFRFYLNVTIMVENLTRL